MDGTLPPGHRLPPEINLARQFQVGQVTLRSALARLEREGLVKRIRSRGTFVTDKNNGNVFLFIIPDGAEDLETPSRYIAAGVDEAARKAAVTIERCPASLFLSFTAAERRDLAHSRSIRGVIVETGHRRIEPEIARAIRELKLPAVIPHGLPSDAANEGFLVLRTDERRAFFESYKYMAARGHRTIASLFIKTPGEDHEKPRGFSAAELQEFLENEQLDSSTELIAILPNDQELLQKQLHLWLERPEKPTAIMCHSDRVAMRVFAILRRMNVRIPEEISLMGYSNFPGSQLLQPALTTTDTCLHACAAMALQELINAGSRSDQGNSSRELLTPFHLIERESVAFIGAPS